MPPFHDADTSPIVAYPAILELLGPAEYEYIVQHCSPEACASLEEYYSARMQRERPDTDPDDGCRDDDDWPEDDDVDFEVPWVVKLIGAIASFFIGRAIAAKFFDSVGFGCERKD